MLGLFGSSIIGIDPLTGPTGDDGSVSARLARHELVRGKPVLQDLGDDAATRRIRFFFDETFCVPEVELAALEAAFRARIPMRLFLDLGNFALGVFVIESLKVDRQKTSSFGRIVRAELTADLIETDVAALRAVTRAAASVARAIRNPLVQRDGS